jgi:hypothetical protein
MHGGRAFCSPGRSVLEWLVGITATFAFLRPLEAAAALVSKLVSASLLTAIADLLVCSA